MLTAVHGEISTTRELPTRCEPSRPYLPRAIRECVDTLEAGWTLADISLFEAELAELLSATHVLCVWMNWPRRIAWSASGVVSDRLQRLVPDVAGGGRCIVLPNALVAPIGPAPACGALVVKGMPDHLFETHARLAKRVAHRIAPAVARLFTEG